MNPWLAVPLAVLGFLFALPYYAIKLPLLRLERILEDAMAETLRIL